MIKKIPVSLLFIAICFYGCNDEKNKADIGDVTVKSNLYRFDKDLFATSNTITSAVIGDLRNKYADFFNVYYRNILRMNAPNDSLLAAMLTGFVTDKDIVDVYKKVKQTFADAEVEKINSDLILFFKYLKHHFPDTHTPDVITYISGFNYNVVTTDSAIGIGLDMYLGKDCLFYSSIGFPQYMYKKFSKEYIVNDCVKGWFQSEYDVDALKKELLSQMIYQGKLLYFTDAMEPDLNDTIKIGFTNEQLQWCKENEEQMWSFFIENKMLYNTNEKEYAKFIQDGNTTQGFPKESPGKTGCYMGWQIVNAYMQNNDVTLLELLAEQDAQKILAQSKFKPKK
jgi:gliding motility-associated lipoprotein GldB